MISGAFSGRPWWASYSRFVTFRLVYSGDGTSQKRGLCARIDIMDKSQRPKAETILGTNVFFCLIYHYCSDLDSITFASLEQFELE